MSRTRELFEDCWKVHVGDDLAHSRRILAKAGTANGWSDLTTEELEAAGGKKTNVEVFGSTFQAVKLRSSTSDAEWTDVELPHDWRFEKKPAEDHPEAPDYPRSWQGFFPSGVAYYRKLFHYEIPAQGQHVSVTFDGVAGFSDIWFNGFWVGQQCTNYTPVVVDITEFLRPKEEGPNVLLVRCDCTEAEGWWYEGGGIYRHVWIETYGDVHIERDGLYIRTPTVTSERAVVAIQAEVANNGESLAEVRLEIIIEDSQNSLVVARASTDDIVTISTHGSTVITLETELVNPKLWELGNARLYNMTAKVIRKGEGFSADMLDAQTESFGVRRIEWVEDGILVNGKWAKLHGANIHQDWAVYGVALPDRVIEAKLELCAEMGVNAIRSAHHPPTPELVAHTDRMGMLLIPEHRLLSTSTFSLDQLRSLIRRFRNHPSVLLWSLENEEMDVQGLQMGRSLLKRLVKEAKALDPDRETNIGGVVNLTDDYHNITSVVGMHYRAFFGVLDEAVTYFPNKPHILDEEGLYASTRGVYAYDKEHARVGVFSTLMDVVMDTPNPMANAALMPERFQITGNVASDLTTAFTHPKVSGMFVWSALDYIGEPTPQRWPATASSYGTRDLCGIPKDYYWILRSIFRGEEALVHALPHWTWPGKEGQQLQCRVYSNCERLEFIVNGAVMANLPASKGMTVLKDGIEYQPGEFVVRGYRGSQVVAEHRQITAKGAASLVLSADRTILGASGKDVSLIRVAITDETGTLIPDADDEIHFSVEGSGQLVGAHNGDPSTDEYQAKSPAKAFNGFVAVFIRASKTPGQITFKASAKGLQSSSLTLTVSVDEKEHQVHSVADEAMNKLFGHHLRYSTKSTIHLTPAN